MSSSQTWPDELLPVRGHDGAPAEAAMTQTASAAHGGDDRPRSDASSRTPTSAAGTTTARGTQAGGSGSDPNSSPADNTGSSGDEDPERVPTAVSGPASTPPTASAPPPAARFIATAQGNERRHHQSRDSHEPRHLDPHFSVGSRPAPGVAAAAPQRYSSSSTVLSRDIMMDVDTAEEKESVSGASIDAERGWDGAAGSLEADARQACDPKTQPQHHERSSAQRPVPAGARNVYVAALPLAFTDTDLEKMLTPFGHLLSRRMFRDAKQATAIGRSYGFALFERPEDAERAVAALNGAFVRDHKIQARLSRNGVVKKARRPPAVVPDAGNPLGASVSPGRASATPSSREQWAGVCPRRCSKPEPHHTSVSEYSDSRATATGDPASPPTAAGGSNRSKATKPSGLVATSTPASASEDRGLGRDTTDSPHHQAAAVSFSGPQPGAYGGGPPLTALGAYPQAPSGGAAGPTWQHSAPYTTVQSYGYAPPFPHLHLHHHHHAAAPASFWAMPNSAGGGALGLMHSHHHHHHHAMAGTSVAWPPHVPGFASSASPMPPGATGLPPSMVASYAASPWHAAAMHPPPAMYHHHTTYVVHVTGPPAGGGGGLRMPSMAAP